MSQETSWTLTNITYMVGSYIMFHYVRGVPFDSNGGAFDNLNMWEQIDDGAQYTPAKKFLLSVPIVLFLLSTHYTHYDMAYFTINFLAVLAVVIPKLPFVSLIPWLCLGGVWSYLLLTGVFFHRAIACAWGYLLSLPRKQTRDYDDDIGAQCEHAMTWKKGRFALHSFFPAKR